MTQYHTCPKCGYKRVRCHNQEARSEQPATVDFLAHSFPAFPDSHIEMDARHAYPTLRYEVYWGISRMSDALLKSAAAWLAINAPMWGIWGSVGRDVPILVPSAVSIISFPLFLRMFGQVPSWHNMIEQEPTAPLAEPPEPEDTREFVGWSTEEHTKTTQRITWYTPPCPISQAQSYALALVNYHFEWIDERDLKGKANISGPNYRKLRLDWIDKGWCSVYGRKTIVNDKRTILKIAFDKPE